MAGDFYLTEFYSPRIRDSLASAFTEPRPSTGVPLEQEIYGLVRAGDDASANGKYQQALEQYLAAWGRLPQLIHSRFPCGVDDLELLDVDLLNELLVVSDEILRCRPVVPNAPVPFPGDPPDALVEITERLTGASCLAEDRAYAATFFADVGQQNLAETILDRALELAEDAQTRARLSALAAVMAMRRGDPEAASGMFHESRARLEALGNRSAAAAMDHNLGVVAAMTGDDAEALARFAATASQLPSTMAWSITQSPNPGTSVTRPVGAGALTFLVADGRTGWSSLVSRQDAELADTTEVLVGGVARAVELNSGGSDLAAKILGPRVATTSVDDLAIFVPTVEMFPSYLAHVRGFILPLALGDTYFALGIYGRAEQYYLKVRDYPYLNSAIELPTIWARLARNYLTAGNRFYRDQDTEAARNLYERIVGVEGAGQIALTGPLFDGAFSSLVDETREFLVASDHISQTALDYRRRLILLEAWEQLSKIKHSINYLGFPDDIIPMHSWQYLQNSARYFANQAIQAERSYVNFKSTAEKDELSRLQLEQSVDAQEAAVNVEWAKLAAARSQAYVASLNESLASERIGLAEGQASDYADMSVKVAYIDRVVSWMNANHSEDAPNVKLGPQAFTLGHIRTASGVKNSDVLGIATIADATYGLTQARSEITMRAELRNMQRKIIELQAAKEIAGAEVQTAENMALAAQMQFELAQLRAKQAHAQLDFFESRQFTPELWENLAQAQRELADRYLDSAIGAAFLMERSFENEYDTEVNRIRFDYGRSELQGLLAGDFLLADVDQFSYDRLLETEKAVPVKAVISLADRYPFQFQQGFQRSGRIDFETSLEDFDRDHPGSFQRKLRRVELVVEGVVGPQGLCGTLTNSGVSYDRGRDGVRRTRFQKPETMILSRYDMRNDGLAFLMDEERVLALFESSGAAAGWILDFPSATNDVDYQAITNIHLVLYFDAYFSESVRSVVRAELAAGASYDHSAGFSLAYQFPEAFFELQYTGEVGFELQAGFLPRQYADPVLTALHVAVDVHPLSPVGGLVTTVEAVDAQVVAHQPTDANGIVSTGAGNEPFNQLLGSPLLGRWRFRIDQAANQPLFDAGFSWEQIHNVYFFAEYTYTPRGGPAVDLDLSSDPLTAFEVVDDPAILAGTASNWSFVAAAAEIRQASAIHGPAAPDDGPVKPGTYLVHRTDGDWNALRDSVVRCRLRSGSPGGIGLVLRYQDPDNFYYFLMDAGLGFRRLGRKSAGVFAELDVPAVDLTAGFDPAHTHELAFAAVGDALTAFLDGEQILAGRDSSNTGPGRTGMYAWNNDSASFLGFSVRSA